MIISSESVMGVVVFSMIHFSTTFVSRKSASFFFCVSDVFSPRSAS
jgi:hypothetical protein